MQHFDDPNNLYDNDDGTFIPPDFYEKHDSYNDEIINSPSQTHSSTEAINKSLTQKNEQSSSSFSIAEAILYETLKAIGEMIIGAILPMYLVGLATYKTKRWIAGACFLLACMAAYATFIAALAIKSQKIFLLSNLHHLLLGVASAPVLGTIVGVGSYAVYQMGLFVKNIYDLIRLDGSQMVGIKQKRLLVQPLLLLVVQLSEQALVLVLLVQLVLQLDFR